MPIACLLLVMTRKCFSPLWRIWKAAQIELQGQYSVERLYRVQAYCETADLARCVVVLVLTALPCLTVALAIESIPLADPKLGIEQGFPVFARVFLVAFVSDSLTLYQCHLLIPTLPISPWLLLVSSCLGATGGVVSIYAMALVIGFPLPFSMILGMPATSLLLAAAVLPAWSSVLRSDAETRKDLLNYLLLICVQMAKTFIYSAFAFAFVHLPAQCQVPMTLFLALFKRIVQVLTGCLLRGNHDVKADMVVFNANTYHVLFVSWCMNGSQSTYSTFAFVLLDLVETLFAFRSVSETQAMILSFLRCHTLTPGRSTTVAPIETSWNGRLSLLDVAIAISELENTAVGGHRRCEQGREAHARMAWHSMPTTTLIPSTEPIHRGISATRLCWYRSPRAVTAIIPLQSNKPAASGARQLAATLSPAERKQCLQLLLRLLYTCEFLLLVELVEAILPAIYLVYLAGIYYLPNRKYFDTVRDLTVSELRAQLSNVAVYSLLELASLLLLCLILQRKLGISPTKQLAFVLESQWRLVQCKLVVWVVFSVQSRLEHFGTDFSFQFKWLSEDK